MPVGLGADGSSGGSPSRHDAADATQPQAAGVRALPGLRHGIPAPLRSALVHAGVRAGRKAPCQGRGAQASGRREDPAVTGTKILAMALALNLVSGCASIAGYQANHPYYTFPGRGGGGGGGNGG
jgi:hypothetical protein